MLREEAYVPFDIAFSKEDGCAKVITGPNMAGEPRIAGQPARCMLTCITGKSSCVRATALIVCMAQIGSFVPAKAARLGIHDAVQTRMGGTFSEGIGVAVADWPSIRRNRARQVDIHGRAFRDERYLANIDASDIGNLGRARSGHEVSGLQWQAAQGPQLTGCSSTYDGVAIAYATLSHVAGIGCNTLFVTHYPMVAEELAKEVSEVMASLWPVAKRPSSPQPSQTGT